MPYASASDVAAICHNLIGNIPNFTTTTCPTLVQVNVWLTTGCAVINSQLASKGLSSISTTSEAYGVAQQANAAYAGWWAERSRISARVSKDERSRADMLKDDFDALMEVLLGLDLSRMGVTQTSTAYAGGISVSDKSTVQSDTDRVKPRFSRGMLRNLDAPEPAEQSSAS